MGERSEEPDRGTSGGGVHLVLGGLFFGGANGSGFFNLPSRDQGSAEIQLNSFLACYCVVMLTKRFVENGAGSFWWRCVDF
jgi:hypothetical protein